MKLAFLLLFFFCTSSFATGGNEKTCSPAEYFQARPDVKAAGMGALVHYNRHGKNENMCNPINSSSSSSSSSASSASSERCSINEYYRRRPDVLAANMNAVYHYDHHGRKEGMCRPVLNSHAPDGGAGGHSPVPNPNPNPVSPPSPGGPGGITDASNIPRGRWAYIDDMVQSLTIQYPTFHKIECRISGDTNAPQDWVATLMVAASYNSFPLFMGASASGCPDAPNPPDSIPGKELGQTLSMGVPVYAGSRRTKNHSPNDLSRKIVAEAKKGPFTIVIGGPFTDVWAAVKSNPEIAINLEVYGISSSNERGDPEAFSQLKSKLGSKLHYLGPGEYYSLIKGPYRVEKMKWINDLRFIPEWNTANTNDVINQNIWFNRNSGPYAKGLRIADVELVEWYFSKSKSNAMDINKVLPRIEDGAQKLKGLSSGGGSGESYPTDFDINNVTWLAFSKVNMSTWKETSRITDIRISRKEVCIDHTRKGTWPVKGKTATETGVEGNPWVIVKRNGRWYGATYEWLRPGQVCKFTVVPDAYAAFGPHIKIGPMNTWTPRSGDYVGFMISSLARMGPEPKGRAAMERSDIKFVRIP
jgi:hypothetical protein